MSVIKLEHVKPLIMHQKFDTLCHAMIKTKSQ